MQTFKNYNCNTIPRKRINIITVLNVPTNYIHSGKLLLANTVGTGRPKKKTSKSRIGRLVRFDSCLILYNQPDPKLRDGLVARFF